MIHHTRRVRQINPQQILGCIPERRGFKKTLTVIPPLQVVPDGQKRKQHWLNAFRFIPLLWETSRVSLVTENGGHSLLPSPLSPIPHSEAQNQALAHPCRRTREICGDYSPTFKKKEKKDTAMSRRRTFTADHRDRGGTPERETQENPAKWEALISLLAFFMSSILPPSLNTAVIE